MPDPDRLTVSGTQCAALFNASPYATRYMLYHEFCGSYVPQVDEDERMFWGRHLQREILFAAVDRLKLEGEIHPPRVTTNELDRYHRHSEYPIGCTLDGGLACPVRGPGIVQVKNVDWFIHNDTWTDAGAPKHIELQLQHEMLAHNAKWGVIAALVGGNHLRIIEREPIEEVRDQIIAEAGAFMESVRDHQAPDPYGSEIEIPALSELIETDPDEVLDIREDEQAAQLVAEFRYWVAQSRAANKIVPGLRAKIIALAGTAARVRVHGADVKVSRSHIAATTPKPRKAYTQVRVTAKERDDGPAPDFWKGDIPLG